MSDEAVGDKLVAGADLMKSYERPPQVTSVQECVLCKPAAGKGIEFRRDESGLSQMVTKTALRPLTLMSDATFERLRKGDTVYLTAEIMLNAKWATATFELEGEQVIVVPTNAIVAFKRERA